MALVGYTNAGKSTLFNRLTGAERAGQGHAVRDARPDDARDRAARRAQKVILSDTVGFISDLPPQLVAAFRATLEEVLAADLILHVRDISHPQSAEQAEDVTTILKDLGVAEEAPLLEVWNKIDNLPPEERAALRVQAERTEGIFAVSALTGEGLEALLDAVSEGLSENRHQTALTLPFSEGRKRAWLFQAGVVESEKDTKAGHRLHVRWTERQEKAFRDLKGQD